MGAERPVASCSGATPMQVSRCGTLPNQTVAKYLPFFGMAIARGSTSQPRPTRS